MITNDLIRRFNNLYNMIGSTPLLEINFKYLGVERTVYVKAEHYNMTGSIKDRMALHILKRAYEENQIKPKDKIIEATSGNTGIAFSAIGKYLGHQVTIFMPDWMSEERKNLIKSFGSKIELISSEDGGFLGSIELAEELALQDNNTFLPRQFSNEYNSEAHYLTTGEEIWFQLGLLNLKPDAVVAGVGTGGTIMGIGKCLKNKNPNTKVYPLEPSNSPTMSTGYKIGKHRIQGISDEFIPPIVKLDQLDEIIDVDDGDAIIMAQKLASSLGLGVGISSGANFIGAIKVQELLGKDKIIVTVFPDDNKKYLSTDLMGEEMVKPSFISTGVELLDFKAYSGKCYVSNCSINNKLK